MAKEGIEWAKREKLYGMIEGSFEVKRRSPNGVKERLQNGVRGRARGPERKPGTLTEGKAMD